MELRKNKFKSLFYLASIILFMALFHNKNIGLNYTIYQFFILLYFLLTKQVNYKNKQVFTIFILTSISTLSTVFTHSFFSYFMNVILWISLVGSLVLSKANLIINSIFASFLNFWVSQYLFVKSLFSCSLGGVKIGRYIRKIALYVVPVIIIIFFIIIYSQSNPKFFNMISGFTDVLERFFDYVFEFFDVTIIGTLFFAIWFGNVFFVKHYNKQLDLYDKGLTFKLLRKRNADFKNGNMMSLKKEYKTGVFLFLSLNILLLIVNIIDINWVWFGFEWSGDYLKQFVHEGTYLLILSILISALIVLFYFRKNLNFFKNNIWLKRLAFLWIAQNIILSVSVAIRNFWYIEYFNLAYKRIGVFIFLIITIYGLYSVFVKVRNKKSFNFLLRNNAFAGIVVLSVASFINWDNFIARYNFSRAEEAFIHYNFLSSLSDKSLYLLDKPMDELKQISKKQSDKFDYNVRYMTTGEYYDKIESRKSLFIENWEQKSILEWNYPEYYCYKMLKKKP